LGFLNSKTNRYLFAIIVIASFTIFLVFYFLNNLNNSNRLINKLENALTTTKNLFEEQKRYALSLSILLSEDKTIIDSFIKKDRKKSFQIVNTKIKTLKQLQNSTLEIQIHNKNLTTYIRSWDINTKNLNLASFRQGLIKVAKEKKPIVSIELGERLNIKAISPIIENNEYLGSVEAIIDFDYLSHELAKKGYELFVLLDKEYSNIVSELKNKKRIKDYILINKANIHHLNNLDLDNIKDYGYISNENYSFAYFSYYGLDNKHLGYIFTGIDNNKHLDISNDYKYETIYINSKVKIK